MGEKVLIVPKKRDFQWTSGLLLANVFIQSIYAIEVCPYIESLGWTEVILANISISALVLAFKWLVYDRLFCGSALDFLSKKTVVKDALLYLSAGVIWGIYNYFIHGFPKESAIKVITGFLSLGILMGISLYLIRKVRFIKCAVKYDETPRYTSDVHTSISRDMLMFALIVAILVAVNGILIIAKDLHWIITLQQDQFQYALKSTLFEIIFVASVYVAYIVLISLSYSSYFKLQLTNQKETLKQVARGNLQSEAMEVGKDEFGVVASYMNSMIHQLKENHEITQSIEYAKRLQMALIPTEKTIENYFPEFFMLFKPRDIVSGDFFWFDKEDQNIYFCVADCTGHGVPGAMVSVVCITALNRSIKEFGLKTPAEILNKTRELVIDTFKKSTESVKDGMDISLCCYNMESHTLQWAGAHNSLYVVSTDGEQKQLQEYKADKQPVGDYVDQKPFTNHDIPVKKGDVLYLFSDGFADQFGGEKKKKFKVKPFKQLLVDHSHQEMSEQKHILNRSFEDWKGELDQVDDVCLMGIKIV